MTYGLDQTLQVVVRTRLIARTICQEDRRRSLLNPRIVFRWIVCTILLSNSTLYTKIYSKPHHYTTNHRINATRPHTPSQTPPAFATAAVEVVVVEAPQGLHPFLFQRHQRHCPPYQPPTTQPQSTPLVQITDLPLFPPCQVPYHHQPWVRRHVPGKVIAAVIHAILTTTALARMYARMVSVRLALVDRIVEDSV